MTTVRPFVASIQTVEDSPTAVRRTMEAALMVLGITEEATVMTVSLSVKVGPVIAKASPIVVRLTREASLVVVKAGLMMVRMNMVVQGRASELSRRWGRGSCAQELWMLALRGFFAGVHSQPRLGARCPGWPRCHVYPLERNKRVDFLICPQPLLSSTWLACHCSVPLPALPRPAPYVP